MSKKEMEKLNVMDQANINDETLKNENDEEFPIAVTFIIGNEFCERFSFYGMKAILPLYLTSWLEFSENAATIIIHTFIFSAYFFALFGGILSDNFIGKFKTILYLSILYCIGNGVMSIAAIPGMTGTPPHWWGMATGLAMIAVGTGGIKPCIASFGGDQFKPSQTQQLTIFFSIFYFSINAGSVLSMFITPLLRNNVHCFGRESCYPLAFGVPAILMAVALIIFLAGSHLYRKESARSNVVAMFFILIISAAFQKVRKTFSTLSTKRTNNNDSEEAEDDDDNQQNVKRDWLSLVSDKYNPEFIEDSRRVLSIFKVFVPISIFWALYDQQSSRWVYQAVLMKNKFKVFGWDVTILPEQMGLANAILILIMIPIFTRFLYPWMENFRFHVRALGKMFFGMVGALCSFIIAAALQFVIIGSGTFKPSVDDPSAFVCEKGCVNILWQIPQYFVIACAEVFLSITGLEFAYLQAPPTMKSVCQAGWLLTVAGGNLIIIFVNLVNPVRWISNSLDQNAWNFVIWTFIMLFGCLIFVNMAVYYEYYKVDSEAREIHINPLNEVDSTDDESYLDDPKTSTSTSNLVKK